MQDLAYYDVLPRSIYYVTRHPEFGPMSGPLGTGATPEEALTDLREARLSLIALVLERGDPVPEPPPVRVNTRA